MASNSLLYYLGNGNVNNTALSSMCLYYNYNNTGNYIENTYGNSSLSGGLFSIIDNSSIYGASAQPFWKNSGSGFYNGTYSYTPVNNQFNLSSITYFMVYEKSGIGDAVLISTLYTGSDATYGKYFGGYEFGVTANNYLYFKYYDNNNGLNVYTASFRSSNKSLAYLNIDDDSVSFGDYNFFKNSTNSEKKFINNYYIFQPSGIYVAYNPNGKNVFSNTSSFNGYIDELVAFSPSVGASYTNLIASGFASDFSGVISGNFGLSGIYSGFTGIYTDNVLFNNEITGYSVQFTGLVVDEFGNQYSGTSVVPLTNLTYGFVEYQSTGSYAYSTGDISYINIYNQNTGYINTFARNSINFLCPISSGDNVIVQIPETQGFIKNDQILKKDIITNSFYKDIDDINIYAPIMPIVNGVTYMSGYSSVTGSFYSSGISVSLDYFVQNNNSIKFGNKFGPGYDNSFFSYYYLTDQYDGTLVVTGFNTKNLSDSNGIFSLPWNAFNYNIIYNGQRLISGLDGDLNKSAHYGITGGGSSIYFRTGFIFDYSTGNLYAIPRLAFKKEFTGNSQNYNNIDSYAPDSLHILKNGIHLFPEYDYIQTSPYDICSGAGIFDTAPYLLYNNLNLFN